MRRSITFNSHHAHPLCFERSPLGPRSGGRSRNTACERRRIGSSALDPAIWPWRSPRCGISACEAEPSRFAARCQRSRPASSTAWATRGAVAGSQSTKLKGRKQNGRGRSLACRCSSIPQQLGNSQNADVRAEEGVETAQRWFYAFFKFSRPHTVLGTFISILSVSLLALEPHDIGWRSLVGLLQAILPALLMNIHIVGLNQIFDVEIDKINKPYLPLASGEFSMRTGLTIVCVSGGLSLLLGVLVGSLPLLATLVGSALLGLAYSVDLPFLRWKQSPVAAAACILAVRAVLVQLGFYFHMKLTLGETQLVLTRPLMFTIAFMLFFSIVIALFKDIPDIRGDRQAGLRTLSVRQGSSRVFWLCIGLLELAYGGAIVAGFTSKVVWSRIATMLAHAGMGVLLFLRAKKTDLQQSKSIYSCYMFVWKLFYAEYLFIPLLR